MTFVIFRKSLSLLYLLIKQTYSVVSELNEFIRMINAQLNHLHVWFAVNRLSLRVIIKRNANLWCLEIVVDYTQI